MLSLLHLMLSQLHCLLLVSSVYAASALTTARPSQLTLPTANNTTKSASLRQLILPNNTASSSSTSLGIYDRTCNGAIFGFSLSLESCADALTQLDVHNRSLKTYGIGRDIPDIFDIALPRRYVSCESRSIYFQLEITAANRCLSWERSR